MQTLRNLAWWLIGLTTLIVFGLVLVLSNLLSGEFWEVPQVAIYCVYGGLLLGLLNKVSILRLGETLIHEVGHAQMAALTFGKVSKIRVERDTSGVTFHTRSRFFQRISTALVSAAGPTSSAVVFLITARMVSSELTAYWALGAMVFISLILVTTVRNFWGWIVGLALLGILYLVLETSGYLDPQLLSVANLTRTNELLVNVILAVTAFNLGSALKYSFACRFPRSPNMDEYKFSKAMFMPGFVGGHLIILIQLVLLWVAMSFLLGWPSALEVGKWI